MKGTAVACFLAQPSCAVTATAKPQLCCQGHPSGIIVATAAAPNSDSLPTLCWSRILQHLDAYSRLHLKLASKRFHSLVTSAMAQLSLSDLKRCEAEDEPAAASCLCITPPRRRIALSQLNHRQRCEQHLAVFLDNLALDNTWPALTALDISTALSHVSCSTLQVLVESLPQLHQLSLPPVATSAGTEAEVLSILQQLPLLCACDLDCSRFRQSPSCSSLQDGPVVQYQELQELQDLGQPQQHAQHLNLEHTQAAVASLGDSNLHDGQHGQGAAPPLLPVQQWQASHMAQPQDGWQPTSDASSAGSNQLHKLTSSEPSTSSTHSTVGPVSTPSSTSAAASTGVGTSSTCAGHSTNNSASAAPWAGLSSLAHVQHLQLQHLQPSCVQDAVRGVAKMPALSSLSVTGLCRTAAGLMLAPLPSRTAASADAQAGDAVEAPEEDSQGQWLMACLQDLPALTRLEIGLDENTASAASSNGGSNSYPTSRLVVPAHTAAAARHIAGLADVLHCTWSQLQHIQELVLHNICLDSPLFAATVECQQLTALHVGGLDLQQDVRTVTGFVATGDVALRRLEVDQHFNLGPNSAAVVLPHLKSLKITHAGNHSPDLSCLEHHQALFSLNVAAAPGAAGSRWAPHSLQVGHLVHLEALRELRLAESCCDMTISSPCGSPGRHGVGGYRSGCSKSSHWLPCCSGHPSQVTSLELSGPVTDHALGQLPAQFPGLRRLTIDSSYFASDGGLQKLNGVPHLELLILRNCRHITDYGLEVLMMGAGIKVVAVQDCAGINERACHRIRKACRFSGSQLLWYGCSSASTAAAAPSPRSSCRPSGCLGRRLQPNNTAHAHSSSSTCSSQGCSSIAGQEHSPSKHCPAGSAFLQRCWREEQQRTGDKQRQQLPSNPGHVEALIDAATAVWHDSYSHAEPATACSSGGPAWGNKNISAVRKGLVASSVGSSSSSSRRVTGTGAVFSSVQQQQPLTGAAVLAAAAGSESRPRRISGSCQTSVGVNGAGSRGGEAWSVNDWAAGGRRSLAH